MLDVDGLMLLQVNFLGLVLELGEVGEFPLPIWLTSAGLTYGQKVE